MATMAVQKVLDSGVKPTYSAANLTDRAGVGNGNNTFLVVKNTDANIKTVTITSNVKTDSGDAAASHVVSVPATTGEVWIQLRKSYDDGLGTGDGLGALITYSGTGGVTGVTSALVQVGK